MTTIGTPLAPSAKRVMMLGSGELGKEVVIELQRFGCEVIAVDRYPNAPAMHVGLAFVRVGQLLPHAPQLVTSVMTSTHERPVPQTI